MGRLHRDDVAQRADDVVVLVADQAGLAHGAFAREQLAVPEGVVRAGGARLVKVGHLLLFGGQKARGGQHDAPRGIEHHDRHRFLFVEVFDVVARGGGKVDGRVGVKAGEYDAQLVGGGVQVAFDLRLKHVGQGDDEGHDDQEDDRQDHAERIQNPPFGDTLYHVVISFLRSVGD